MDRKLAVIGFTLFIMGCTTTQEIKRPDGQTEYLIACGASLGWNVCYKKANKICPTGYKYLCTIIFIFPGAASPKFGANAQPPVRKI